MARYELWLTDDSGQRIADSNGKTFLKSFLSLTATRSLNQVGQFTLSLPPSFDESLLAVDRMVQVWRRPTGGQLGLWRIYFIRRWRFATEGSRDTIEISGPDSNDLLCRRVIAAYSGDSVYAAMGDEVEADAMMSAVVAASQFDAVGGPATVSGTREWSNFDIAAPQFFGPVISKTFPLGAALLTDSGDGLLPQISRVSRIGGTEIFFDVVPNVVTGSSVSFQFRTYATSIGPDVSDKVVFAKEFGNLKDPVLEFDYTGEVNYVYSGGKGEGADRRVTQSYDVARYSASRWNRREGFAQATNEADTDAAVEAFGNALLAEREPKVRFSGTPMDTRGTRFQRDWDFGCIVKARYRRYESTHLIRAVTLTVDGKGRDEIKTRLDWESQ
jgi:hypothetical protein